MAELPVHLTPDIKSAAVAEAAKREVSFNDIVVSILAEHFDVPFEPARRRGSDVDPNKAGGSLRRIPDELYEALKIAAHRQPRGSRHMQTVVETVLRERLGLDGVAA